jgi:hypothetical protein
MQVAHERHWRLAATGTHPEASDLQWFINTLSTEPLHGACGDCGGPLDVNGRCTLSRLMPL